jgi:hypothetical protein
MVHELTFINPPGETDDVRDAELTGECFEIGTSGSRSDDAKNRSPLGRGHDSDPGFKEDIELPPRH